jgi:hypothetical protein
VRASAWTATCGPPLSLLSLPGVSHVSPEAHPFPYLFQAVGNGEFIFNPLRRRRPPSRSLLWQFPACSSGLRRSATSSTSSQCRRCSQAVSLSADIELAIPSSPDQSRRRHVFWSPSARVDVAASPPCVADRRVRYRFGPLIRAGTRASRDQVELGRPSAAGPVCYGFQPILFKKKNLLAFEFKSGTCNLRRKINTGHISPIQIFE